MIVGSEIINNELFNNSHNFYKVWTIKRYVDMINSPLNYLSDEDYIECSNFAGEILQGMVDSSLDKKEIDTLERLKVTTLFKVYTMYEENEENLEDTKKYIMEPNTTILGEIWSIRGVLDIAFTNRNESIFSKAIKELIGLKRRASSDEELIVISDMIEEAKDELDELSKYNTELENEFASITR